MSDCKCCGPQGVEMKRWQDLSPRKQMAIKLAGAVQVSLLIAALCDIWRRPAEEVNGDRRLWTLASFVNFVGPISYFVFGRKGSSPESEDLIPPTE
jgi:hypothetical protein